ncbi:glycosyltransferase [Stutzerimonas chloritidismutans]|uniref:glycosyltransferase n=1 Tax=Stutzerimonas stutzeri subgroup TaxID=578833 RepID=UPI00128C26D4
MTFRLRLRLRLRVLLVDRAAPRSEKLFSDISAAQIMKSDAGSFPLVSVCISAYNHEKYLASAIDSVLNQTYQFFEIIIVDDASSDGTGKVIREYLSLYPDKIKAVFLTENEGPARASNRAFEIATGEYIAFLGSDDRMLPDRILQQAKFLNENPLCVGVFSDVYIIGADGRRAAQVTGNELLFNQSFKNLRRQLLTGNFINAPSAMVRRVDLLAVGGYSPLLRYVQDYDLWGRLLQRGKLEKLFERLTEYRVHDSNMSIFVSAKSRPQLAIELISVIVQFTRIWPLESLLDRSLFSEDDRVKALLELAGLLQLVDYHYLGKPALASARAYEIVLLASQIDAVSSLRAKQHLEACFAEGFAAESLSFLRLLNHKATWFVEPINALGYSQSGLGGLAEPMCVDDWLKARSFTSIQKYQVSKFLQQRSQGPSVAVVLLDLHGEPEKVMTSLASLSQPHQLYTSIQPIVLTVNEIVVDEVVQVSTETWLAQLNEILSKAEFDWFVVASAGDEFTANGLLMAGLELLVSPECRAVYCDEIYRQADGNLGVALRPSFNLDYVLSFPTGMARHWLFRRDVFLEAGCFNTQFPNAFEFEFILRLVNQGGLAGLGHISEPLLITEMPVLANVEDERLAIIRHLQARGYPDAQVTAAKPGRYHLEYKHAGNPVVSILIMAGKHLSKLQRCIEGLLGSTAYQAFEILLVESHPLNQVVHEWLLALAELQEAKLRVVQPASQNMATMLNEAANQASGDYLLFLAPDTATLEEDWLDNLLNHAQRAEVGGVGGRLLTPDGKIAQGMQILGLQGPLGNPYIGEKIDEPGYMQRLQVDQNVSALSQDCLMLPRDLFIQLKGLDEKGVPSPYAVTDLCLRIREAGYLLVWSPSVQLMLDRQDSTQVTAQHQDAMYAKWLPQLARDPAYNPNFSLVQPGGFKLADTQISWRPLDAWRPLPVVLAHPADTMGCGHYRVMQPFNALCEAGMVDGGISEGLMHVVDFERYDPDAVILQRQIGEVRLEAMRQMKAFSRAFKVYELDDYLPNLPMKSVHRQHMPRDIVKSLRKGLSYVDRFVVSTDVMAEAFADFHPDIRVVKNRLDPRWWGGLPVSARRISKKPRVGWAGGSSHTGDLEMVADVVKELAGEVEWVFFGMCPEKLKPYVHEFHEGVAIEIYAKKLASLNLDLALAPVEQNLFNECKSNLRLLEYGACGFPVICSDVRCYQGDGLPVTRVKNRFRDWVDAIRAHINDLDSAARAGGELRSAVLNGWMLEGENLEAWRKVWLPD